MRSFGKLIKSNLFEFSKWFFKAVRAKKLKFKNPPAEGFQLQTRVS